MARRSNFIFILAKKQLSTYLLFRHRFLAHFLYTKLIKINNLSKCSHKKINLIFNFFRLNHKPFHPLFCLFSKAHENKIFVLHKASFAIFFPPRHLKTTYRQTTNIKGYSVGLPMKYFHRLAVLADKNKHIIDAYTISKALGYQAL